MRETNGNGLVRQDQRGTELDVLLQPRMRPLTHQERPKHSLGRHKLHSELGSFFEPVQLLKEIVLAFVVRG